MVCRKCSVELPEQAVFCFQCGAKQSLEAARKSGRRMRANGMGTAYKRGKTWTASVTVGWNATEDKRLLPIKRTKGGFKTKKEALEYCATLFKADKPKTITLEQIYQQWDGSAALKLSDSKRTAYKIAHNKLKPVMHTNVADLTIHDLQSAVDDAAQTFYPARDMKVLLSHLYKRAVAEGYARTTLPDFIALPALKESEQEPFSEEELRAMWKDYGAGNTLTGYLLLMVYSGMMPGELFTCKKSMINWTRQEIVGCGLKTKKRKETPIIIADIIIPVLADLCRQSKGEKLLTMNKWDFYAEYKRTLERIGARPLPMYSCRHSTATALALGNIAPSVIQEIMRHTKFATTQRYIHVDTTPMLEAINRSLAHYGAFTDNA